MCVSTAQGSASAPTSTEKPASRARGTARRRRRTDRSPGAVGASAAQRRTAARSPGSGASSRGGRRRTAPRWDGTAVRRMARDVVHRAGSGIYAWAADASPPIRRHSLRDDRGRSTSTSLLARRSGDDAGESPSRHRARARPPTRAPSPRTPFPRRLSSRARAPVPSGHRVHARPRVAVFVDGCFWHSCPEHGNLPKANREWWRAKLAAERRAGSTERRSSPRCGLAGDPRVGARGSRCCGGPGVRCGEA